MAHKFEESTTEILALRARALRNEVTELLREMPNISLQERMKSSSEIILLMDDHADACDCLESIQNREDEEPF